MIQDKWNSQLSKNFQWKYIVNWLFFCKNFRQGICKNAGILTEPFSGMVKRISLWREYRGRQGLCSTLVGAGQVQLVLSILWEGYRERSFPVQVKGGSHCPVGVMLASLRTGDGLTLFKIVKLFNLFKRVIIFFVMLPYFCRRKSGVAVPINILICPVRIYMLTVFNIKSAVIMLGIVSAIFSCSQNRISVSWCGGEYRGRSPLCKGTGSATSLCRSRAAAIAQRSLGL